MGNICFKVEQIALYPVNSIRARDFLSRLGLNEWHHDQVTARGEVFGESGENQAHLAFNYQAGNGNDPAGKPLELEVLDYTDGPNWMDVSMDGGETSPICGAVSHLGMHVTEEELQGFDAIMREYDINIAQRVRTKAHTNPAIKDSRRYMYVIYDTRALIGVDLKFIVRLPVVALALAPEHA
jgi:hypothetical protein